MSADREPGGLGEPVRLGAPAKVNLTLEVLARRPDGFHEIETTMLALELADVVAARRRPEPGIGFEVSGPHATADVPRDERNLAVRAARSALEALAPDAGLQLTLEKHVPSGAGLGGGSSDAAAALVAAERALGGGLGEERRTALLASLGSDCVFFEKAAATGFASCRGRGDEVRPHALPPGEWTVVVLAPDVHCDTGAVYGALGGPLSGASRAPSLTSERFGRTEDEVRRRLFNRLEAVALGLHHDLRDWRALLDGCGAGHFRLSGSGSSFFGLFRDVGEAGEMRDRVCRAAERRGLALRGHWVTRPAGTGRLDLERGHSHRRPSRP